MTNDERDSTVSELGWGTILLVVGLLFWKGFWVALTALGACLLITGVITAFSSKDCGKEESGRDDKFRSF